MQFAKFVRGALLPMLAFLCICTAPRTTIAEEPYKVQIDSLRKSLEKYQDYTAAVRDLYLSTVGCVHYAGENSRIHGIPKRRHGHSHYQSDDGGHPRPDEAQCVDLRTREKETESGRG